MFRANLLQCVAVCCSVLQCVDFAIHPPDLRVCVLVRCFARICCSVFAVCCSVLQCVAVCCNERQLCDSTAGSLSLRPGLTLGTNLLQCVAMCHSALRCVAVCWSVLECVGASCSVLQCADFGIQPSNLRVCFLV